MPSSPLASRASPEDPPLADLLRRLHADLLALLDTEKELAKAEMDLKWQETKTEGVALVAVATLSLLATLCLTASSVLALSTIIEAWLVALLIGGSFMVVSAIAFLKLRTRFRKFAPLPKRAMQSIDQDIDATKEAVQ